MPDIQNNFVQSKMNQDLDDRLIPPGEYRSAQNVAISRSQGEDVGALENIEGNSIVNNDSLPADPNLDVIGYFVDPSENNVYLFYTDYVDTSSDFISNFAPSTAKCIIYKYNSSDAGTWTKLVEGSFLNFSKNSPIYGISMIENLLFFTDYRNQPRKINVTTAAGDISYYQNEDQISVAKFAPVNPPRFVDMAYNNKLKSTISNPSEQFLPINFITTVNSISGTSVSTMNITQINSAFKPYLGSKISCEDYPELDGKIITSTSSTSVSWAGSVDLTGAPGSTVGFQPPNPDYDADWAGDPNYVEDRFIRFSYRFKFDDGEYSIIAPFSQSCFVPKQAGYFIDDDDKQAFRSTIVSFMENNATQVVLNIEMPFTDVETKLNVSEVEILYKESDQVAIKSVESIPIDVVNSNMQANANSSIFTYKYLSTKPYKLLPEDQTTRVYDKVPVRAFSQETSSNRIIYGNFIDKHSSPDELNYGVGFFSKEITTTPDSNTIYSQIEYPNHTLKQNRNYQIGVVLADRYGRSSTTILSSQDKKQAAGSGDLYGNSTIYVPYQPWANPSSNSSSNGMFAWPGYALSVLFNNLQGQSTAIPTAISNGYPGTYVPIGAVGSLAINAGGSGYSNANNVATTGGTGSGLTVDITVTAGAITGIEIAKMGEGYTDGNTITVTGGGVNATATITLAEPNLLGWYSYKFVVRQTEQDYYNVYLPGILNNYPSTTPTANSYPDELNKTAQFVLINDNINKVPRDLSEVGPDQKQFRSSVQLFGIVENTQPIASPSTVSSSIQYTSINTGSGYASIGTQNNTKSFTVNTIATASDLNMSFSSLNAGGQQNFYQLDTNPLIARISTDKAIGAVSNSTAADSMSPQLAILETEAVESLLDIYWETTTTGLVEDLNLEVKQASTSSGASTPSALSSTVVTQNENQNINDNIIGNPVSPILPKDSAGNTVLNQNFSLPNGGATFNSGQPLNAKDVNNVDVTPFTLVQVNNAVTGNGFYIKTNGFFNISSTPANNNYNLIVRSTDSTGVFVDFTLSWTIGNSDPGFGSAPGPYTISSTGVIASSNYLTNAVNGVNSNASTTQKQLDLSFSIASETVRKGNSSTGPTDSNNYGFSIAGGGANLVSSSPLPADDNYFIPIIITDGGGRTATVTSTVTVETGEASSFQLIVVDNTIYSNSNSTDFQYEATFTVNGATTSLSAIGANGAPSSSGTDIQALTIDPWLPSPANITVTLNKKATTQPSSVPNIGSTPGKLTFDLYATVNPIIPISTVVLTAGAPIPPGNINFPISGGTANTIEGSNLTTNPGNGYRIHVTFDTA